MHELNSMGSTCSQKLKLKRELTAPPGQTALGINTDVKNIGQTINVGAKLQNKNPFYFSSAPCRRIFFHSNWCSEWSQPEKWDLPTAGGGRKPPTPVPRPRVTAPHLTFNPLHYYNRIWNCWRGRGKRYHWHYTVCFHYSWLNVSFHNLSPKGMERLYRVRGHDALKLRQLLYPA